MKQSRNFINRPTPYWLVINYTGKDTADYFSLYAWDKLEIILSVFTATAVIPQPTSGTFAMSLGDTLAALTWMPGFCLTTIPTTAQDVPSIGV